MTKVNQYTSADIDRLIPPFNVTKIGRVLQQLGRGEELNNRSAFEMGDTCLHSTISKLRNDYGIAVTGEPEKYVGHDQHPSQRHRYWIETDREVLRSVYRLLRLWGWTQPEAGEPSPALKLHRAA